jgi:hypothetical protein
MSIKAIRETRCVPAKRGMRVRYNGPSGVRYGTIKSARGGYLRILLDGDKHAGSFHPTWALDYLDSDGTTIMETFK